MRSSATILPGWSGMAVFSTGERRRPLITQKRTVLAPGRRGTEDARFAGCGVPGEMPDEEPSSAWVPRPELAGVPLAVHLDLNVLAVIADLVTVAQVAHTLSRSGYGGSP